MSTLEIDPDEHRLEQFLIDGDPRQVWTRTRDNDDVLYLEDGRKADYDATRLACIVRGCDGPITLVEGERRTHYRHKSDSQHRGSQAELYASAALVEAWMTTFDTGPIESTEHRDAEIIARSGAETVAYVVISEKLQPEAWRGLRGDVAGKATRVQWFLWAGMLSPVEGKSGQVRIPKVAELILDSGDSVLVVNPGNREIGTLISAGDQHVRPSGKSDQCFVSVCSIEDCTVSPEGLMTTPTMSQQQRWLEKQSEQKARQEAAAAPMRKRPAPMRPAPTYPEPENRARTLRSTPTPAGSRTVVPAIVRVLEPTEWNAEEAWATSKSRMQLLDRFGEPLSPLLTHSEPGDDEIDAVPAHWHCVLYMHVLEPMRRDAAVGTIADRLARHQWPDPVATSFREGHAVRKYLEFLSEHGVLSRVGEGRFELAHKIDGAPRRPAR